MQNVSSKKIMKINEAEEYIIDHKISQKISSSKSQKNKKKMF